jgi:ankyrin repeat protein
MNGEALFEALVALDVDAAHKLLRAERALARARDATRGSTPLHFAAHRGLVTLVDALLVAGADVHAREEASGATAMHWAAEAGQLEAARRLGRAGARLTDVDDWYGLTPLGWGTVVDHAPALRADRPATLAALRRAGARPDLFTAVAEERYDEITLLARDTHADRLGFAADGYTALHLAAERGTAPTVTMLLQNGADPLARSTSGLTPLAVARRAKNTATARALRASPGEDDASVALVTGDDAALKAWAGWSAPGAADLATRLLAAAARGGRAGAVPFLVRKGADVNARVRALLGERAAWVGPLHLAAAAGGVDAVGKLLDAKATVDLAYDNGPTALVWAAGHPAVEALLRKRGATG